MTRRTRFHLDDLPAAARPGGAELKALGLDTVENVWRELAAIEWKLEPWLGRMNARRDGVPLPPLTRLQLAETITVFAERDERLAVPRARRASQVLGWLVVPTLLVLAWQHARLPWPQSRGAATKAVRTLPPYRMIQADDVREEIAVRHLSVARSRPLLPKELVVGRYTTRAVSSGEVFQSDQLRDGTVVPELNARAILTIPVRPVDSALTASLPAVVTLLCADEKRTVTRVPNVYLLAVARELTATRELQRTSATIAVAAGETVSTLLASPTVTIAWNVRD